MSHATRQSISTLYLTRSAFTATVGRVGPAYFFDAKFEFDVADVYTVTSTPIVTHRRPFYVRLILFRDVCFVYKRTRTYVARNKGSFTVYYG